ncbi:TetR/AcrR family transcriptional regulator [Rhizobiaceae bacterium BDR2-2]|uniref:TetR/AcrR family transcriptional regulator n=1 Tax=Ectorhizobium quercum TaxID=2965071 RepID=A0AAE3N2I9_9HYPH|nr:TetR/AcrR family transcriptional regulator [Ectorhizobium quercum]MCX8997472.1 TetR/AcrR family transcriptional regulator [Ectorhizobium quercum]
MTSAHSRRKQPERVRRALLDAAEKLAVDQGVAGVTIQAVADAAGVTKGGLFHHFPSKQALVEGMFADLLESLDAQLEDAMSRDAEPRGRFTRAYVDSMFVIGDCGQDSPWAALLVSMMAESELRRLWSDWLAARLHRHHETDGDPMLEIVRLAADGAWLAVLTSNDSSAIMDAANVRDRLLLLTRG